MNMNEVLFSRLEKRENHEIVIKKENLNITAKELKEEITKLEGYYSHAPLEGKVVCLAHANPIEYMFFDLFLLKIGAVNMTVPLEFSDGQIGNFFENADYCIVDSERAYKRLHKINNQVVFLNAKGEQLNKSQSLRLSKNRNPHWRKIVHTSGTTSNPKGAIVNEQALANMLDKLLAGISDGHALNYFSFQPMSLLIEQILALYLPLASGGKVVFKPDSVPAFGLTYKKSFIYLDIIRKADANFYFLPPRLIEDLAEQALNLQHKNIDPVKHFFPLKETFLMTGGAAVNQEATSLLDELGICVYEAYGTSENASVISLNTRKQRRKGSVGKPLKNTQVKIIDGEIAIRSNSLFCGYLTRGNVSNPTQDGIFLTGDMGELDKDGYLYVNGRKKNIIILSSARNICPEHIESVYRGSELIQQVVVFGDGKPYLSGIVIPTSNDVCKADLDASIKTLSSEIPSFSQLKRYFIPENQKAFMAEFFTITGRPKRDLIKASMQQELSSLYQ